MTEGGPKGIDVIAETRRGSGGFGASIDVFVPAGGRSVGSPAAFEQPHPTLFDRSGMPLERRQK